MVSSILEKLDVDMLDKSSEMELLSNQQLEVKYYIQGPSASAYVTYYRAEDALKAIQAVNNIHVDGRTLKASLGTTKYCSHFLKNQQCPKSDCMYLHELGDELASFTKEEMQQGKHQEYERKLYEQVLGGCNHLTR
ncbi:CCR4-NOT transcription complex subunit 4-like [Limulus polyphemus]|uniref:CCR4-NOT transcription complex subunit 4-like n=1 Tax=Limulus polyphemus TaxID=6850 RepID=A0ABM1TQZ8_LIMPO|nr:CCR4-NOT transcription complex subunit 4-like [Limulus polyphemus]